MLSSHEKNIVLEICHRELLEYILQIIELKIKENQDTIYLEEILDRSNTFYEAYKNLIGFKTIENCLEKKEQIQDLIRKYVNLVFHAGQIKNNLEIVIGKMTTAWGMGINIKIINQIMESKNFPTVGLYELIPDVEDKSLVTLIHSFDLFYHISFDIKQRIIFAKEIHDKLFSFFTDHANQKPKNETLPAQQDFQNQFISAVKANNEEAVVEFILKGVDINALMSNSAKTQEFTPLYYVCCKGFTNIIEILLKAHANINIRDTSKDGFYPVHAAVVHNQLKSLQLLVELGQASIEVVDNFGNTALHLAALHTRIKLAEFLITNRPPYKPYLTCTNFQDQSAFDIARKKGNQQLIDLFRKVNNNNETNDEPKNNHPLFFNQIKSANSDNKLGVLSDLVNFPEKFKHYHTNLMADTLVSKCKLFAAIANETSLSDIQKIIMQNTKEVYEKDKDGNTSLHIAALYDKPEVKQLIEFFVRKGCSFSEHNNLGMTPTHSAVACKNKHMLSLLTELNGLSDSTYRTFQV